MILLLLLERKFKTLYALSTPIFPQFTSLSGRVQSPLPLPAAVMGEYA